ncbi:arabinogalactan O-methyltransferase 2 [Corylus avellana]|uniref:arabinogalactan O-methyltransferase 2 n=1 Tax=Corylus avellana TaxID=13451 RepID=UPI001E23E96C|nr:arabinogalactan O-methyltransferase 2 [Corylus avellana]
MPPEVPHCRPLVTLVQFSPQQNLPIDYKYFKGRKKMNIPIKKLLPALVLILSSFSIIRFLLITITTSSSSTRLPTFSTFFQHTPSHEPGSSTKQPKAITEKEFHLLSNLVAQKSPCNLLIFGLEPKYLYLSQINAGGTTVFLEDDIGKLDKIKANSNSTKTYKVEYQTPAKEAYKLLKHARQNPACEPGSGPIQASKCRLALRNLPQEVYQQKWDVIVVDGPSGDTPEAPGRMATIYSASIIARAGNTTDVAIHDVHRMIEKWFSWEFLCDENLVSSKGNLWIFRIRGQLNSTTFCSARPVVIE